MHSINSALYEMRVYEKRLYEIGGYRIFVLMKTFQKAITHQRWATIDQKRISLKRYPSKIR